MFMLIDIALLFLMLSVISELYIDFTLSENGLLDLAIQ